MTVDHQQTDHDVIKHGHRHEGPYKHVVAFIFSIVLTLIAFAAVAAGGVNTTFTVIILLVMAVLQVLVQLGYWMHMKDKGHFIPILFLVGGFFVAFTCVVMALSWVWW
ncbi:cytochrome C oxidase subunit IV family protein [Paenibacillus sediminis]|uniref:Cytochrome c oxidase subunit 4 n=1 Tax=Paenibacillus sediminis TaxID=664909 RepID=A0ABS4H8G9_9BACL|nr:cytochrome C oxidase subunit IV family protein [Paenibacillus sediminis]MBP1938557.1 cytochrome c oxidase subunit 4 [Paenibacillus sediminis]